MKKWGLVLVLIVALLLAQVNIAVAASAYRYEQQANILHSLGLYDGSSTQYFNPDLSAKVDRQVAIMLLLKMFGKRDAVNALPKTEVDRILSAYTDSGKVVPWVRPYIAYGIKTKMVFGTSKTTLGPLDLIDSASYSAMILRNLGYTVDGGLFPKSVSMLGIAGGLSPEEVNLFASKKTLIKDDLVGMSFGSLNALNSEDKKLIDILVAQSVVSHQTAVDQGLVSGKSDSTGNITKPAGAGQDDVRAILLDALLNSKSSVSLPLNEKTDTADEVFALINSLLQEDPRILYYAGCTYYSNGLVKFQYAKDPQTAKTHGDALELKANDIIAGVIKPEMSDYEKELAIHDYIVNHCRYDTANVEADTIPPESFSAYGALVNGVAVCEGYAEAMKLLLDKAGVPTMIVIGYSQGVGHAWNLVKIQNSYYQVDATWDDPVMNDGTDVLTYTYFNLTDEEMAIDHIWEKKDYPAGMNVAYNYHQINKLTAQSSKEFIDIAVSQLTKGNKTVSIKLLNGVINTFNMDAAISSICMRIQHGVMYMVNQDFGVVDITLVD